MQSFTHTLKLQRLVLCILLVALSSCALACVETADCDQTTPCSDTTNEICYRFRCLPRCSQDNPVCSQGRQCRPCQDNCQGDEGFACVIQDL